jgi:surface polysaccharide O-acyltransferase-like enzyme
MRINRIDSFRNVAILAVICIHTKPFLVPDSSSLPYKLSGILINQGGRFAVPFFLIISGYLFGCKLTQGVDPFELGKRYSSKILPIFFFWDLVYLLSLALTEDVLKYGVLRPIYWNVHIPKHFGHPFQSKLPLLSKCPVSVYHYSLRNPSSPIVYWQWL